MEPYVRFALESRYRGLGVPFAERARSEDSYGPKPDINRTMPKSWQLAGGQSANHAKNPTAKERGNEREEIGGCKGTEFLRAVNTFKPDEPQRKSARAECGQKRSEPSLRVP